jgi:serine/threonine-protein kinase
MAQELLGFSVVDRLGQGAASEVYLVRDPRTRERWTLKHVVKKTDRDERYLKQVEDEYAIGRKLDHPAIRGTKDLLRKRKLFRTVELGLLLEFVDGVSLDRRMPKTHAEAARLFAEVARGLEHLHQRGFVHADLKPTNILMTADRKPKLIDLGQACAIGTVKERIQGTPGYMAPEQAHREAITPATDTYNFGATLYWVLTGELIPTALPPAEDRGDALYRGAIDASRVRPPVSPHERNPAIHPRLSELVMMCVRTDPHERPHSMAMIAKNLDLTAELLEAKEKGKAAAAAEDDEDA